MTRVGIVLVVLLVGGKICSAQTPPAEGEIQSPAVRSARELFDQTVLRAQGEYLSKASAARTKYLQAVEAAIRQATRAGDLDESLRLKAEKEAVLAEDFEADLPRLWGAWDLQWGHQPGTTTRYRFFKQGFITRDVVNAPTKGVIKRIGRDLTIDFGDNSIVRINLAGQRLILEYWEKPESYPTKFPELIGFGTPVTE